MHITPHTKPKFSGDFFSQSTPEVDPPQNILGIFFLGGKWIIQTDEDDT